MSTAVLSELKKRNFFHDVLNEALQMKGEEQEELFRMAREARDEEFTDKKVEVRSVIEVSNICAQNCRYCNMGKDKKIRSFMLENDDLYDLIEQKYLMGRRVILLQSGEYYKHDNLKTIISPIEKATQNYSDLVIILCLGNMKKQDYVDLKKAGASRYILKFESSNQDVYNYCKPNDTLKNRMACIEYLFDAGFEVGSGNIVGLPNQKDEDIVNDLLLMRRYNFDMNSSTAFIPAEQSEFKNYPQGDINKTLNVMVLMRIMNPKRLMPTTSSLEKIVKEGQYMGLMAGANTVTIHDGTPDELKALFPIYSVNRFVPKRMYFDAIVQKAGLKM